MPTILFNGKTYNSIEEMPVDVRSAYQQVADIFVDKNGNGIPDFLEGDMVKNVITAFTSNVNVNGQTYNNMNELPPDIRAQVQGAFEKLSALGMVTNNNSPSIPQAASPQIDQQPIAQSQPLVSPQYASAIQEGKSSSALIWVILGLGLVLCLLAGAVGVFFYLNNG